MKQNKCDFSIVAIASVNFILTFKNQSCTSKFALLFTNSHRLFFIFLQNTKAFTNYYVEVVEAAEDIDEAEAEEDYEFLEQLLQSRELNALVKAHNVILFCNQEQCPCVSNACQITADVMEDIRPFALMMEECRELYALLSAPHVRVSTYS